MSSPPDSSGDRYDAPAIERKWQALWDNEGTWEVPNPGDPGYDAARSGELRARDAALSLGRAAHRAPQELLDGRRARPLPPSPRHAGAASDGLRRVRAAGGEPRDQDRRAPGGLHGQVDRGVPPPVPLLGRVDRLAPRVRNPRAAVLPLDAVDLPEAVRARARVPQARAGEVVPARPDRARQRAGDRRRVRAVRHAGRREDARAVVPEDHRLRGPAARRLQAARVVAAARDHDAAQLDRPLRGRGGRLPLPRPADRLPGLHDAPGHAVRRDVLRARARASRSSSAWSRARPWRSACASTCSRR